MSIEEAIFRLADSDLSDSDLVELSGLDTVQRALFENIWATIKTEQQRDIIRRLVELTNKDVALNYKNIFKSRLKDPDAEVRREAIEGLWECEEHSLIPLLVDLLENDISETVRNEAASALGRFAMLAEHGKLSEDDRARVCQALLSTINDSSKPMALRCCALESAAPLSQPEVINTIRDSYYSGDDRLALSSIYAMGTSCDPSWMSILLEELSNRDAERRRAAASALGELEDKEAVTHLAELIYDDDTEVQLSAIHALGEIGGSEARECLEMCLDEANPTISQAAEKALDEVDNQESLKSFEL